MNMVRSDPFSAVPWYRGTIFLDYLLYRAMKHLTSDNGMAEADFKEVFYFCVIWPTTDFHWRSGFQYSFCLLLVASKVGKMA